MSEEPATNQTEPNAGAPAADPTTGAPAPTVDPNTGAPAPAGGDQPPVQDPNAGGETPPAEDDGNATKPQTAGEYTYEAPEGVTLDPKFTGELTEFAKREGLTPDKAREIAGIGVKMQQAWEANLTEKVGQTLQQMGANQRKLWQEQAAADKEFGGEQFKANQAVVNQALDQLGTPELKEFLDASGLGDHPEVVRLLYRVGTKLKDDSFVTGGEPTGPSTSNSRRPADVLYGS